MNFKNSLQNPWHSQQLNWRSFFTENGCKGTAKIESSEAHTSLKLLADENIGSKIIDLFRKAKFDIVSVPSVGLNGCRDRVVLNHAAKWQRVLVTYDKKLASSKYLLVPENAGVVLLPAQDARKKTDIIGLMEKIVTHFAENIAAKTSSLNDVSIHYHKNGTGIVYCRNPVKPSESVKAGFFYYLCPF